MTAVHNSNPDVGRECIAVNRLNKCLTCLGLKRRPREVGVARGKETTGFATPSGLLPLRALAGTAKKRKLEAEASES